VIDMLLDLRFFEPAASKDRVRKEESKR